MTDPIPAETLTEQDRDDLCDALVAYTTKPAPPAPTRFEKHVVPVVRRIVARHTERLRAEQAEVTWEEAQALDIFMADHMYGHQISNSPNYFRCDPGCRVGALQTGVNKILAARARVEVSSD
jgi:hypothetical protein